MSLLPEMRRQPSRPEELLWIGVASAPSVRMKNVSAEKSVARDPDPERPRDPEARADQRTREPENQRIRGPENQRARGQKPL